MKAADGGKRGGGSLRTSSTAIGVSLGTSSTAMSGVSGSPEIAAGGETGRWRRRSLWTVSWMC